MTPSNPPKSALPKEIEDHLAEGNIEVLEEIWLARLEEPTPDVPFFASLARGLDKAGAPETAQFLLELLDEQLSDGGLWQERLELLRRARGLLFEPEDLHPAILECLENLHGDLPSYEQMVEKVGLHRAVDDIPKTWQKVARLQGLLAFDVGSIVYMEGKGAGRVLEVNMALESFKVEFETGLELRVGFGGAAKLLQPLAPDHVLYRKMTEPAALKKLRDEQPAELLRTVLESYGKPRTGAEIKRALAGVVPDAKWSRWWTAARKHPQVLAASEGRRAYSWAASSEDAHDAVWQTFEEADPRARMSLLRRDGGRDPGLRRRMSEALAGDAAGVADSDPGLACEIWFHLERSGEPPPAASWSPRAMIPELEDPRPLFRGVKDRRGRENAYEIARETREDWPELYQQLLWQESDPRCLELLSAGLIEASPQSFESFLDQLLSQPRRNPGAFTWLAESAAKRPERLRRNPLRLLNQLLWALASDVFSPYRASRLMPLTESGGTLPRLISELGEDQAAQAYATIRKTPALKSYQREPLLNAILMRFPALREEAETPLYATRDVIEAKRAELRNLKEVEIPANRRAIQEARELGDLSENFEYKSARQRHEYLAARAAGLSRDLARARPIDPSHVKGDEVVIGSRVQLVAGAGEDRAITILGPWNSKPERDILSHESELAKSLLGLAPGDQVELAGIDYRVESIEPFE